MTSRVAEKTFGNDFFCWNVSSSNTFTSRSVTVYTHTEVQIQWLLFTIWLVELFFFLRFKRERRLAWTKRTDYRQTLNIFRGRQRYSPNMASICTTRGSSLTTTVAPTTGYTAVILPGSSRKLICKPATPNASGPKAAYSYLQPFCCVCLDMSHQHVQVSFICLSFEINLF